jgi:hypothetical protein
VDKDSASPAGYVKNQAAGYKFILAGTINISVYFYRETDLIPA